VLKANERDAALDVLATYRHWLETLPDSPVRVAFLRARAELAGSLELSHVSQAEGPGSESTEMASKNIVLTLSEDEAQHLRWALAERLLVQARVSLEDIGGVFDDPRNHAMHLHDAAWKVREQAALVDLLERVGFEGVG